MSKKILIVDDAADIRTLLEHTLEELQDRGVELLSAANGEKGLSVALVERPDLIFLDIKLPDIDGYEVCQHIKAVLNDVYVILLTGHAVDMVHCAEVGADDFIAKPFYPDQILERAAAVLGLSL